MGHTMWCLMRHPERPRRFRAECRAAFTAEDLRDARPSLDDVYAKLKYTERGGDRKRRSAWCLRPPAGFASTPRRGRWPGTTFPRGTCSPPTLASRFLDEGIFRRRIGTGPERFLDTNANDPDAFFPGGMGQHRCPGISLSTLMACEFF